MVCGVSGSTSWDPIQLWCMRCHVAHLDLLGFFPEGATTSLTKLAIVSSLLPGAPAASAAAIEPILVVRMAGASLLLASHNLFFFAALCAGAASSSFLRPAAGVLWATTVLTVTSSIVGCGAVCNDA